jgi:threonine aldolase
MIGMKRFKSFASDNNAPVHDKVFNAMLEVNEGDAIAYGDDPYTDEALQLFKELFGPESSTFLSLTVPEPMFLPFHT